MMYILDTNVISEARKLQSGKINPRVASWAEAIDSTHLFLSVITIMELEMGILSCERKDATQAFMLRTWLEEYIMSKFAGRILPVDTTVARCCAILHVPNRRSERDALIAATALVRGMTVVTRNVRDFEGTGVPVLNPWE